MIKVTSQKEFDKAYKNGDRDFVVIGFTVNLHGSSSASLHGSSRASLHGSSRASLHGSSRASLYDSSSASLHWSSRASLHGSSSAFLRGSSSAEAFDFSILTICSKTTSFRAGNMVSIVKPIYPNDIKDWCKLKGIKVEEGRIMLWKCVEENGYDFRTGKINYTQKSKEIIAPDWDSNFKDECGCALHLADSPSGARSFLFFDNLKTARLLKVSANIKDCIVFGGSPRFPMKLRARACRFVSEYPVNYMEGGDETI